jgi:UDP-glucose 4-epimerase
MIERILTDYRSAYGLGSFCLRYFNASGADASGEIGELRDRETHLIPRAMMALQGHVADFAVFGDDYATPDGTAIRDYIHVADLAEAHVLALKLLMQGHLGGAFNLGSGTGFSVRQILSAIAAETGRVVPHVVKPRRPGDPTYLVADASAALKTLRFRPAHSDLATIIRTAWAWHRKAHPLKATEPFAADTALSPAA